MSVRRRDLVQGLLLNRVTFTGLENSTIHKKESILAIVLVEGSHED